MSTENITEIVKEKYGQAALRATSGGSACCGSAPSTCGGGNDPITSNLYDEAQKGDLPETAVVLFNLGDHPWTSRGSGGLNPASTKRLDSSYLSVRVPDRQRRIRGRLGRLSGR